MDSGVQVNGNCVTTFQDLKVHKDPKVQKLKYIIFKLNADQSEIIVQEKSHSTDYEDFLGKLPENECRWAVYDFEFEVDEGNGKRQKLCFISWSPDTAKIRQKMAFASSQKALRLSLVGIAVDIQGTDRSEVEYAAVLAKAKSGTR